MFPSHNQGQGQGQGQQGNLEDRLRGMILSNANKSTSVPPQPVQPAPPPQSQTSGISSQVPPHLRLASDSEKAEYFAKVEARKANEQNAPQVAKQKRPNQAQRRQMNSQLSIPIDTRPVHNTQAGRSPGYSHSPSSQHSQGGFQNQRHHYQQQNSPRYHNGQPSPYAQHHHPQPSPFSQHNPRTPQYQQNFSPNTPSHPSFRQNNGRQGPNQFQSNQDGRPPPQHRQLYHPGQPQGRGPQHGADELEEIRRQSTHLENLAHDWFPQVEIGTAEEAEKEAFRSTIETICRETITNFEVELGNAQFNTASVELQCFGSMRSGYATQASDMDLALLAPNCSPAPASPESRIPRLLEKKLLSLGYGARLLTRTRVPIIKLCEKPTEKLLADLLEERAKWDNGIVETEEHDHDDEEEKPHSKSVPSNKRSSKDVMGAPTALPSVISPIELKHESPIQSPVTPALPPLSEEAYQAKLSGLKQQAGQNLFDYQSSAKRLLRKLGGRDVTANSFNLNEHESKLLNDVCKYFILGLQDDELSQRLRNHLSIALLFDPSPESKPRTLQGVWTQAEGDRLAMAWANRPFIELTDKYELEASDAIQFWNNLQEKTGTVLDPIFYNRQLRAGLEKLRKINSLQVLFLQQSPFEEPNHYFTRTQKIQQSLRGPGGQNLAEEITEYVKRQYIAGLNNSSISKALQTLEVNSLSDLAREHVRMQLAIDYEHAIGANLFKETDLTDVQKYVDILLSGKASELSVDPELLRKMKILPDPTHVSTLKPRDPYKDKLEFPKTDIGIQCDINFSAHLALHNTLLLRCYAVSDPRVRPMILFVKHWAKVRGINIPYRGTLSSYGYVLMVLHYLVNVAHPFVCPNLQHVHAQPPPYLPPSEIEARSVCEGRDVRFWRNELEIKDLAERGLLNHNKDILGFLLRGFFEYYAQSGFLSTGNGRGFEWGREVLSLRTQGGILTKTEKGWVGAKTVVETSTIAAPPTRSKNDNIDEEMKPKISTKTMEETKEIRHRYLFAIEDPFELDHNVARTVTHDGIVSVRDEFRRAWRIIRNVGKDQEREGLLDPIVDSEKKNGLKEAMVVIHGIKAYS